MKKGISLIVLVITIIVMIIIAGAIIISLNNSNIIAQSNTAVQKSNKAEADSYLTMLYAEVLMQHNLNQAAVQSTAPYVPSATANTDHVEGKTQSTDVAYFNAMFAARGLSAEWEVVYDSTANGYVVRAKSGN